MGFKIIKSEQRWGTRKKLRTEWLLFKDGILLAIYHTRREAREGQRRYSR